MSENAGTGGGTDSGDTETNDEDGGDREESVRVWMVERGYTNRDLITLVYATPDGERAIQKERAAATMGGRSGVSAAREVDPDRLEPVTEEETVERYRKEAERTIENYDPEETI